MLYLLHLLLLDFCQVTTVTESKYKHTHFPHTVAHACAISAEYLKIFVASMLYLLHSLLLDFCQVTSVTESKYKHTYFSHTVAHACAIYAVIHLWWRLHPT